MYGNAVALGYKADNWVSRQGVAALGEFNGAAALAVHDDTARFTAAGCCRGLDLVRFNSMRLFFGFYDLFDFIAEFRQYLAHGKAAVTQCVAQIVRVLHTHSVGNARDYLRALSLSCSL